MTIPQPDLEAGSIPTAASSFSAPGITGNLTANDDRRIKQEAEDEIMQATIADIPDGGQARSYQSPVYGTVNGPGVPTTTNTHPVLTDQELRLYTTHSLGRSIRILALLDGFFLFMNYSFFLPLAFLFCIWGPIAGYDSGKNFNVKMAHLYFTYYILRVMLDTFIILSITPPPAFTFINLVIDFILLRVVRRYAVLLAQCSEFDLESLRNDLIPLERQQHYFVYF
ncbi:hypothetical protein ScalyP_jg7695 [Parmales sp. scaly parma]|jgi:hypothetical protein|nr:hypothetical protein ScalyP_jg7695 [Parmales sp. scaly parma]